MRGLRRRVFVTESGWQREEVKREENNRKGCHNTRDRNLEKIREAFRLLERIYPHFLRATHLSPLQVHFSVFSSKSSLLRGLVLRPRYYERDQQNGVAEYEVEHRRWGLRKWVEERCEVRWEGKEGGVEGRKCRRDQRPSASMKWPEDALEVGRREVCWHMLLFLPHIQWFRLRLRPFPVLRQSQRIWRQYPPPSSTILFTPKSSSRNPLHQLAKHPNLCTRVLSWIQASSFSVA